MRGRSRRLAQRPLPSMMMATWCGSRAGSRPAAVMRSRVSGLKVVGIVLYLLAVMLCKNLELAWPSLQQPALRCPDPLGVVRFLSLPELPASQKGVPEQWFGQGQRLHLREITPEM